ncbi:MAG: biotin/lipoyl-binding protein [Pirellulales bacterium]
MLNRKSSRARVRLRRIAVTAVILAVGAAWAWLAIPSAGPQSSDAVSDSPSLMTVEVRRAQKIDVWESKARCSGMVRAKRKSDLGFERSGRVERVLVEQGERVDKDAVLATLNAELPQAQLRKLKADLQAAEAVLAEMIAGPRKEVIEAARAGVQQLDV